MGGGSLQSPSYCNLVSLSLAKITLRPRTFTALLRGIRGNLRRGRGRNQNMAPRSADLHSLRHLDLSQCGCFFGTRGATALKQLLELTCVFVPPKEGVALASDDGDDGSGGVLREIVLQDNHLGAAEHLELLAATLASPSCRLAMLDLSRNAIHDAGLITLSKFGRGRRKRVGTSTGISTGTGTGTSAGRVKGLRCLRLRRCRITTKGVCSSQFTTALCQAGADDLCAMDLSENQVRTKCFLL